MNDIYNWLFSWAWAVEPEKFVRPISVERGYGAMA
jgi:hypothetical protein